MRSGFTIFGADTRLRYANPAFAEMHGWDSPESLIGVCAREFFDPKDHYILDAIREDVVSRAGGTYTAELLARGGRRVSMLGSATPIFDADGSHLGNIVISKPVGPAKHLHEEAVEFHLAAARTAAAVHLASVRQRSNQPAVLSESGSTELRPSNVLDLSALSPRETDVVQRLADGEPPSAIAANCHISRHTVRNHFKSIFRKLGVHSQLELLTKVRASSW